MSKISNTIWKLAEPVAHSLGLEIWDIEYVKEAGQYFLRIYIDKKSGISINDCEMFSKEMDPILDSHDPIPDSYVFEVSSAGAERTLRRPSDFERFLGHNVEVKLYKPLDGKKLFTGKLIAYENGVVSIESPESQNNTLCFDLEQTAYIRLRIV